ncbi:hypothetical protein BH09VER1_BH09VER1_18420 [soil metagenome]
MSRRRSWYFCRIGGFSAVNDHVLAEFRRLFADLSLVDVDVIRDIVRPSPLLYGLATVEAILRYGATIARTRIPPRDFMPRLPRVLRAIAGWMHQRVDPAACAFTFQTQSLFDARRPGVPHFIYTDHTYLANQRYGGTRAKALPVPAVWREMERTSYLEADLVFTTSDFAARSVVEDYGVPPERVLSVQSGINTPFPDEVDTTARQGRILLFVAVEWERKGGPELFQAFLRLASDFPDLELHVVGCSPALDHPRAFVHGRLPLDQVAQFYRRADIFCLLSRMDPSAVVLTEAASYCLPVVGTRVGGNAERVLDGETGFLLEPGDEEALFNALTRLLRDPALRERMGRAGRERVRNMFTWKAVCEKMAVAIRRVAALS